MSFVLPFNFKLLSEVPIPTNPRVKILSIPKRILAVKSFSGYVKTSDAEMQLKMLKSYLEKDNFIPLSEEEAALKWSVAQYHPPFTIPFLRRNELWIELDQNNSNVLKLLSEVSN